ncbi:Histidine phosphatase superfamily, clade-1 [Dillenia turbinata]|uniref:Histidine phosphatase superfamily, clade-1 n=1 Tax=Dillenia turbinata TaxID=194707 RepID=A0AAN8YZ90_9MAGN
MSRFSHQMRLSSSLIRRFKHRLNAAASKSFATTEGSRPVLVHKRSVDILQDPWFNEDHRRFQQNVVVMRHGDRADNVEPLWISKAERPWDPPLVEEGLVRAYCTGRKLRTQLGFPIHRVFVSPFLRCVQTAAEVIAALSAVDDDRDVSATSDGVQIDPSKIKVRQGCGFSLIWSPARPVIYTLEFISPFGQVSIEYGLCEMLNREAIRTPPKDGNWGFNIVELQAMFPAGTVDHSVGRIYKELPHWEETVLGARNRYERIIQALADKYPSENLLLITHGEAVGVAVYAFLKDTSVYEVEYCAYSQLRRSITFGEDQTSTAGNFEVINRGQTGISFCSLSSDDSFN